jgi:hypothetical protein
MKSGEERDKKNTRQEYFDLLSFVGAKHNRAEVSGFFLPTFGIYILS